MADGDALHVTRTKALSAVGVRKHWKKDWSQSFFRCFYKALDGLQTRQEFEEHLEAGGLSLLFSVFLETRKAGSPMTVFQPSRTPRIT